MRGWSAWRFTVIALLALIAVVATATIAGLHAISRTAHAAAVEEAQNAPEMYRLYRAKLGSMSLVGPAVARSLSRNGVRVIVLDRKARIAYNENGIAPEPFFVAPRRNATRFGARTTSVPLSTATHEPSSHGNADDQRISTLLSLDREHPVRVDLGNASIILFPDLGRYLDAVHVLFTVALTVFIIVSIVIVLLARTIVRAANRPIEEVTRALERLAERDFTPRMIVADPRTRTGRLAHAYNAAAEAVAAAFDERRAAQREMQRFIADAGHELRTPLTIVSGFVDVLDGGPIDSPGAQRIYTTMRAETRRMRGLIEKLITLARLESPDDQRTVAPVDARSIARRVADSLTILAHPRQIHVIANESAKALADEDELFEAIFNCVENALKYAPASDVVVTIGSEGGQVVVTIADEGPGMTSDEHRHAFERFYRGETRGEVTGSGLGLAIVKSTLERVQGSVDLQTAPGEGTRVTLRVPAAPAFA